MGHPHQGLLVVSPAGFTRGSSIDFPMSFSGQTALVLARWIHFDARGWCDHGGNLTVDQVPYQATRGSSRASERSEPVEAAFGWSIRLCFLPRLRNLLINRSSEISGRWSTAAHSLRHFTPARNTHMISCYQPFRLPWRNPKPRCPKS
jgi:hypothetical protein